MNDRFGFVSSSHRSAHSELDSRLASYGPQELVGVVKGHNRQITVHAVETVNLPMELHSSVHQVRYEDTLLGEYITYIYPGLKGPVVVFTAASRSPLPLEYLSEHGVRRFLESLPNARLQFFERHFNASADTWVELVLRDGAWAREPRAVPDVQALFDLGTTS